MSKTDRALNLYQTYSVAKISALSKQQLIAQYAQCDQIGKLEKNLQKELRNINSTNQQILEHQLKEAKKAEDIKYYRSIAHNCKEAIVLIQEQENWIIKSFLYEIFHKPLHLHLQVAKDNLEEISDMEFCSYWIKQLASESQSLSKYEQTYLDSSLHKMIIENPDFISHLDELNTRKRAIDKKLSELTEPTLKQIPNKTDYIGLSGCFGCLGIILCMGIFGFAVEFFSEDYSAFYNDLFDSPGFIFIFCPIILIILLIYFNHKKSKEYPSIVKSIEEENVQLQLAYENQKSLYEKERLELDLEKSKLQTYHPYIIAKKIAYSNYSDWENIMKNLQNFLPTPTTQESQYTERK